jgi:hypothetical protein
MRSHSRCYLGIARSKLTSDAPSCSRVTEAQPVFRTFWNHYAIIGHLLPHPKRAGACIRRQPT